MSRKSLAEDKSEAELMAACDEATKAETQAEATIENARILGTQKGYGIAVMAAIAARERSWNAQKALKSYRAGKGE